MGLHSCIARATRACNGRLLVQACNFSSGIPSHSRSSAAPLFSNSQPSIWGSHLSHLSLTSRAFGTDKKPADSKKITAAQGIQIDRSTPEGEALWQKRAKERPNFWDIVALLPKFGLHRRFTLTSWGSDQCYWTVTRVRVEHGRPKRAWGIFTWNGVTKSTFEAKITKLYLREEWRCVEEPHEVITERARTFAAAPPQRDSRSVAVGSRDLGVTLDEVHAAKQAAESAPIRIFGAKTAKGKVPPELLKKLEATPEGQAKLAEHRKALRQPPNSKYFMKKPKGKHGLSNVPGKHLSRQIINMNFRRKEARTVKKAAARSEERRKRREKVAVKAALKLRNAEPKLDAAAI